jgi:hypothetical protein
LTLATAEKDASLAAHTLRTGQLMLFDRPDTRLAILPIYVPVRLDRLTFSPEGRRASSQPLAPGLLFGGIDTPFRPDLAPVARENIVPERKVVAAMRASGMTAAKLWSDERPDATAAREIGRRLDADYVLVARVADVEIDAGPTTQAEPVDLTTPSGTGDFEREARVEVTGALIHDTDGVVAWSGWAAATMVTRSRRNGKPIALLSEPDVIRDAARFAVKRLQRDFADFRSQSEN